MLLRIWKRRCKIKISLAIVFITFLILVFIYFQGDPNGYTKDKQLILETELEKAVGPWGIASATRVLPNSPTTLINPMRSRCEGNGTKIHTLIFVNSFPRNKKRRDDIRNGIRRYINNHNKILKDIASNGTNELLFFTGLTEDPLTRRKLENEAWLYQDIIIENIEESYLNLSLKSLRMLKWVEQNCYHAQYFVKIDDDVHLNLGKLFTTLHPLRNTLESETFYGGHLFEGAKPIRDPNSIYAKSYTPFYMWSKSIFPTFIGGGCYVMGRKTRSNVYARSLILPMFHLEDVFLSGIIANMALDLTLTDMPITMNFWSPLYNFYTSPCDIQQNYVAIHFHSEYFNYLDCWKEFNSIDYKCNNWPLFSQCWFK